MRGGPTSPSWSSGPGAASRSPSPRLISLVEDGRRASCGRSPPRWPPHAGRAHVVGLTGPPGVGKSTTTSALVTALRAQGRPGRRARGRPVLAVLRRRAARRPGADGRARHRRGGVHPLDGHPRPARRARLAPRRRRCACSTPPAATWCSSRPSASASPRSRSSRWPTPPWCCSRPGMGDGVQAAKAGILEVADVFVVNKADRDGADPDRARPAPHDRARRAAARWRVAGRARPSPSRGEGVDELVAALDAHRQWSDGSGERDRRRVARAEAEIEAIAVARCAPASGTSTAAPACPTGQTGGGGRAGPLRRGRRAATRASGAG